MTKQTTASADLVSLSVRVTPEIAAALKEAADASYRPVAAEMRRLIEARVERFRADRDHDESRSAA